MTFQTVAKGGKLMATWNIVTLATVAKGNKFLVRTLQHTCMSVYIMFDSDCSVEIIHMRAAWYNVVPFYGLIQIWILI